ncbi:MAG: FGGY-family carbohydrate kinase [Treponema sp.]|nr:FGGY-family carbohydrate kinase [Treponema sp.]
MILTVDIGTSAFKSAVWDLDGTRLSFASVPLKSEIAEGGKHEAAPSQWLEAFDTCCANLGNIASVQAIVISGNGPSLVPVLGELADDNSLNVPAEKARLWLDRRGVKYSEEVSALMNDYVDSSFFLPKILHIKREENNLYQITKKFLGCPEFLAYTLTGQARTVFPCEGFDRWFWNDAILEKLNLDAHKFPPFIRPGDSFGSISQKAAERFGFKKDIQIISGGPDFFTAILGSGVMEPGQACNRTGSSDGINLCTVKRINHKSLMSYAFPIEPYWNLSGMINTTGRAIEWGKELLGLESIGDFMALAEKSGYGSGGLVFLPYLSGERSPIWNPNVRALWNGINIDTGRSEFANSILEGIGFAINDVISVMEQTGEKVEQIYVTGGLAGFERLNQIKADITGKEIITCACKEAELLGLAVIGSCFLGKYSSFTQAVNALRCIKNKYKPNSINKDLYNHLFYEYKKLRDNML